MENTKVLEFEGRIMRMGKDSFGMLIKKKLAVDNKLETGKRYLVRLELKELV